jgi:hypothetical protein
VYENRSTPEASNMILFANYKLIEDTNFMGSKSMEGREEPLSVPITVCM